MTALAQFPPLALDRSEKQFLPEVGATGWIVKHMTRGRPKLVKHDGEAVVLPLDASIDDLEEAVKFTPGLYRLYQVDEEGNEVGGRVAHIEITIEYIGAENQQDSRLDRVFELAERLAQANEHKDLILADITKALVTSQVDLQNGSAALLNAATETIRVANGVDALEREPHVDVEELSERLTSALALDEKSPDPSPWFVQLLSGPVGMGLMQFANNFVKAMAEAQARQAQAQAPTAAASKPEG